ncbi:WD repeat-containing protein 20, partial [Borealophlyctis nickersoniae]
MPVRAATNILVAIVKCKGSIKRISFQDKANLTWSIFAEKVSFRLKLPSNCELRLTYRDEDEVINVDNEEDFNELLIDDGAYWPVNFEVLVVNDAPAEEPGTRGRDLGVMSVTGVGPTTTFVQQPAAVIPADNALEELRRASGFDLMLSYQWDHQVVVKRLRDSLQQRGFNVWMDLAEMHGSVYDRMYEAVTKSKVICSCLTRKYELSANCKRELQFAADQRKSIVPTRLDKGPFTWSSVIVAGLLYVELADLDEDKWEEKMNELTRQIQFALGMRATGEIAPATSPIDPPSVEETVDAQTSAVSDEGASGSGGGADVQDVVEILNEESSGPDSLEPFPTPPFTAPSTPAPPSPTLQAPAADSVTTPTTSPLTPDIIAPQLPEHAATPNRFPSPIVPASAPGSSSPLQSISDEPLPRPPAIRPIRKPITADPLPPPSLPLIAPVITSPTDDEAPVHAEMELDEEDTKSTPATLDLPLICRHSSCNESFGTLSSLWRHAQTHVTYPAERYKCLLCQKLFSTFDEFESHGKEHCESRNMCYKCGRKFTAIDLHVHLTKGCNDSDESGGGAVNQAQKPAPKDTAERSDVDNPPSPKRQHSVEPPAETPHRPNIDSPGRKFDKSAMHGRVGYAGRLASRPSCVDSPVRPKPVPETITIKVQALSGKTIEIHASPSDSIRDIKLAIREKEGVPPDQQRLIRNGEKLEDDRTAAGTFASSPPLFHKSIDEYRLDYGFGPHTTLHLVLSLRGGPVADKEPPNATEQTPSRAQTLPSTRAKCLARRPGRKATARLPLESDPLRTWIKPVPCDYQHLLSRHHPGTRGWLLSEVNSWLSSNGRDSSPLLWLRGAAGMGKSVMAALVAHQLAQKKVPHARFFCKHDDKDRSDPFCAMRNTLWGLCEAMVGVRTYVESVRERDPDLLMRGVNEVIGLIIDSVRHCTDVEHSGNDEHGGEPIVIIINALDECKNQRTFLSALTRAIKSPSHPGQMKWFLTGRPEWDIVDVLSSEGVKCRELVPSEENNREDILLFTEARLALRMGGTGVEKHLMHDVAKSVAEKAEGVFMYAYLRLLQRRFRQIDTLPLGTDHIYYRALNVAYPPGEPVGDFHKVMGAVVVLAEPLTISAIAALLNMTEAAVWGVVNRTRSVLDFTEERKLRVLHKSLADYLTGRASDWRFRLTTETHNEKVAVACMESMMDLLERNMCLLIPMMPLDAIADLPDRIVQYVPEHLQYAVRFWITHLDTLIEGEKLFAASMAERKESNDENGDDSEMLSSLVLSVLEEKLLNWVESLALLSNLNNLIPATQQLELCLGHISNPKLQSSVELASDLRQLVTRFYPLIQSKPQSIYTTALPFCPWDTKLFRLYVEQNVGPKVVAGQEKSWSSLLLTIDTRSERIRSAIVWPDGSKLATASNDGTVRIWDAVTGMSLNVIQANDDWVRTVALAEGGKLLLTNGKENDLKVWDAESGELRRQIPGHSAAITRIVMKPDGKTGVCSSKDGRIGAFSVDDNHIGAFFTGHKAAVNMTVSADGSLVLSGSVDKTCQMWNTASMTLLQIFEGGHDDSVTDAVITSDNNLVITGGRDACICLWDAAAGALLHKVSEAGHRITALSLLPNLDLVTCGSDGTAWVRDISAFLSLPVPSDATVATKGIMGTLNNWSETGYSIAVFPQPHEKIVIGCRDEKIRIYTTNVERLPKPTKLTDVQTVAVARSGRVIATGDEKGRVKVWSLETGDGSKKGDVRTLLRSFEDMGKESRVGVSANGKVVAVALADGTMLVWDSKGNEESRCNVTEGVEAHIARVHPKSAAVTSSGHKIVVGAKWIVKGIFYGLVRVWDRETACWVATLNDGIFNTASISDCGTWVTLGDRTGDVRLWNTRDDSIVKFGSHSGPVVHTTVSPNGSLIASASKDCTVHVYSHPKPSAEISPTIPRSPLVLTAHEKSVFHIGFSGDGTKLISSGSDQCSRLWDLESGTCMDTFTYPLMEWRKFAATENVLCVANRSGHTALLFAVYLTAAMMEQGRMMMDTPKFLSDEEDGPDSTVGTLPS